jgi:anti-sigma B factor antagonist
VEYDINDRGDFILVSLSGEVDLFNSPHAREVILGCLENDRNLLISLADVKYIDSSGIASLVEGFQTAKNKSLKFGLVHVSEAALNVLKLAHLDKVFPLFESESDF